MQIIDNINQLLGEALRQTIKPKSCLKIAAACFSIYAFEALQTALSKTENWISFSPSQPLYQRARRNKAGFRSNKTVFFVNHKPYDLIACFDHGITEKLVKELATHKPVRVVFRDNGFASDAVKINVEQIFRQLAPATDVKSI